jgi:hypothetical protein
MAPILTRTPLAAISFRTDDGADHVRVYYQDREGNIRETFYDGGSGWNRRDKDIVGKAKLNSGIAAVCWDKGTQIRVYYLSEDSTLVERAYTGGAAGSWFDGSLTAKKFPAAPYSSIAAVPFSLATHDARVYYQNTDNEIVEAALKPEKDTWIQNGNPGSFPTAIPGSSISAVASAGRPGQRVWVYFQRMDTRPVEYQLKTDRNWVLGGYNPTGTFAPGADIAAVHWGDYNICVLAVTDANVLVEQRWIKNQSWQETSRVAPVITNAPVVAIHVPSTNSWVRAYTQAGGQIISEQGSDDGGQGWITMQDAIPVEH